MAGYSQFDWESGDEGESAGDEMARRQLNEVEHLIRRTEELLKALESPSLMVSITGRLDPSVLRDTLMVTLQLARLSAMSLGECQAAVPYAPIRPIIGPDGKTLRWCRNHSPEHCT